MAKKKTVRKLAKKSSYSKWPVWQKILAYVVIGGVIYFAIYYLFMDGISLNYGY